MINNQMSQSEKVQNILAKLENMTEKDISVATKQVEKQDNNEQQQTVSDDFNADKAKESLILEQEHIIRNVLALFDINYDDLIRMDGKSAYCQAVQFYPHLINEVKQSPYPALTALQIAKNMQPYLNFTSKYGKSLDEIKENLKKEIKQESSAKPNVVVEEAKPIVQSSIFSDIGSAITQNKKEKPEVIEESLASFFNR